MGLNRHHVYLLWGRAEGKVSLWIRGDADGESLGASQGSSVLTKPKFLRTVGSSFWSASKQKIQPRAVT